MLRQGREVSSPAKRERKGARCTCNGIGEGVSDAEPRPPHLSQSVSLRETNWAPFFSREREKTSY